MYYRAGVMELGPINPDPESPERKRMFALMHSLNIPLVMTQLSRAERRNVVERFYEKVADGIDIDQKWIRQMIETSVPELPDEPSPEQCDAWIELSAMLNDPSLVANIRANAEDVWNHHVLDLAAWQQANELVLAKAKEIIARDLAPTSEAGQALARDWLETSARLLKRQPDLEFRNWIRGKYALHDARAARYWELVAIMRGSPSINASRAAFRTAPLAQPPPIQPATIVPSGRMIAFAPALAAVTETVRTTVASTKACSVAFIRATRSMVRTLRALGDAAAGTGSWWPTVRRRRSSTRSCR